jgi:tetratricopeptide (TPR) repeat protein
MKRSTSYFAFAKFSFFAFIGGIGLMSFMGSGFLAPSSHEQEGSFKDVSSLIQQINILNQHKDHTKALKVLLSALENEPEDSFLKAILVQTFDLFLEEEVHDAKVAIQKNPNNIMGYSRMADSLELLGDRSRAMEILLVGMSKNHRSADLWMAIARLELKAGRDMEALDVFHEVIKLDCKNSDAYNNAAYILARAQKSNKIDLKRAENLALNARKLDPKNPRYLDTLAEVHFRQGKQKQALELIKEAIKLAPREGRFKDQLARFKGLGFIKAQ